VHPSTNSLRASGLAVHALRAAKATASASSSLCMQHKEASQDNTAASSRRKLLGDTAQIVSSASLAMLGAAVLPAPGAFAEEIYRRSPTAPIPFNPFKVPAGAAPEVRRTVAATQLCTRRRALTDRARMHCGGQRCLHVRHKQAGRRVGGLPS